MEGVLQRKIGNLWQEVKTPGIWKEFSGESLEGAFKEKGNNFKKL